MWLNINRNYSINYAQSGTNAGSHCLVTTSMLKILQKGSPCYLPTKHCMRLLHITQSQFLEGACQWWLAPLAACPSCQSMNRDMDSPIPSPLDSTAGSTHTHTAYGTWPIPVTAAQHKHDRTTLTIVGCHFAAIQVQ